MTFAEKQVRNLEAQDVAITYLKTDKSKFNSIRWGNEQNGLATSLKIMGPIEGRRLALEAVRWSVLEKPLIRNLFS